MRIRFKVEGGIAFFPGLSSPVAIDSGELPEEEATELERRVGEARFFDLPVEIGKPHPGAADHRPYAISVEDGAVATPYGWSSPWRTPTFGRWWRPSMRR